MKLNEIKDNQGARKDRKRVARGIGSGSGIVIVACAGNKSCAKNGKNEQSNQNFFYR